MVATFRAEDGNDPQAAKTKAGSFKGTEKTASPLGKGQEGGEKAGQKIIQKEKVETGRVKMKTVLEYLKACKIYLSVIFLALYLGSHAADIGSNFWLSKWTNNFKNDQSDKIYNFGIYVAFGFGSCEIWSGSL